MFDDSSKIHDDFVCCVGLNDTPGTTIAHPVLPFSEGHMELIKRSLGLAGRLQNHLCRNVKQGLVL